MKPFLIILIIILILVIIVAVLILTLKKKFDQIMLQYFNTTSLKQAIDNSKIIESNTPKTLSSMESVLLPSINRDFKELNINEIKRMAEENIIYMFNCLENKEIKENKKISDKVITIIKSKISDLNKDTVHFDSIKFHKTVISKYEKKDDIVTLYLDSSLEYKFKINNDDYTKVQTRFKTEFVYIVNANITNNKKVINVNCPNCGAPVENYKKDSCPYCSASIIDIVKRTWIMNNIQEH